MSSFQLKHKKQQKQNKPKRTVMTAKRAKALERALASGNESAFGAPSRKAVKRRGNSSAAGSGRRIPMGVSMVNDGVNTGSIWKNTTSERVTFPLAREKFADLTSTGTTYQVLSALFLNPGNSTLFPVFSEIAKVYEEYIPNVLRVYYRTKEYTASGSTVSAGLAGMAVAFDANDSNFSSMTNLENYEHSISGAPFSGIMCLDVLEMHRKRFKGGSRDLALNNFFVWPSSNTVGPTSDQAKWYDVGKFQCAVDGTQAGIIGELWIEYSFTMIRRKMPENGSSGALYAHLRNYADNATAASPLGLTPFSSVTLGAGSNLSTVSMVAPFSTYVGNVVGLNDASDTTFNLPNISATWYVGMLWTGALTIAAVPAVTGVGATELAVWGPAGAGSGLGFFLAAGTSATFSALYTTTRTDPSAVIATTNQISIAGLTGMTSANVDIFIMRVPDGITYSSPMQQIHSVRDELTELRAAVQRLERSRISCDSDFDDEHKDDSSSSSIGPLSRSTVDIIGELIARKQHNAHSSK